MESSDPRMRNEPVESHGRLGNIAARPTAILAIMVGAIVLGTASAYAQQTVRVRGNHAEQASNLGSQLASNQVMHLAISLALRNRVALEQLIANQQDPASPHYHQWLKPAEFNARFGRSPAEVAAVKHWLVSQGFNVTATSPLKVEFTTTVMQAERAFDVRIAATSDGRWFGNASDPLVPAQLSRVVGSVEGLSNLRHFQPAALLPARPRRPQVTPMQIAIGAPTALFDISDPLSWPASLQLAAVVGEYNNGFGTAFGPQDMQTFYDETPLLNSGTNGGSGDCLALAEASDYYSGSVNLFNSNFGLPALNITRVFVDGSSPGINGDEVETLLDIEWAHAVAPGAPIDVYIGNSTASGDPLLDAISAAVNANACGAISISFGYCGGSSSFYSQTLGNLFAQAAAQGQSVFVSTGDQGSAGLVLNTRTNSCVTGTSANINEMAADWNVTAVGGTQFTPVYSSNQDVGDVPESVWNDQAGAGGGGVSTVFTRPPYQQTVLPNAAMREIPDVSMGASPYSPGFYFGDDLGGSGVAEIDCCIGGTSIAAPMWAGLSKLIAQNNGRLGAMNARIYQLGNGSAPGIRDVTSGNNAYNGVPGAIATAGYDDASGWGSADMASFAAAYPASASGTPTPTATPSATPTTTQSPTPTPTAKPTPTSTPNKHKGRGTPTPTPTPQQTPGPTPTPKHGHH